MRYVYTVLWIQRRAALLFFHARRKEKKMYNFEIENKMAKVTYGPIRQEKPAV